MRLFHRIVLMKYLIKKSCNLIDWEYIGLYLWHKILSRNTANNKKKLLLNKLSENYWPIFF